MTTTSKSWGVGRPGDSIRQPQGQQPVAGVGRHLGQPTQYSTTYDPKLLVREARQNNRKHLGISNDNLPFYGVDVWNCYEVSVLNHVGRPQTGILKIVCPANSKFLVESKSLKLYLNSYNMTLTPSSVDDILAAVSDAISTDLSALLDCDVQATIALATTVPKGLTPISPIKNLIELDKLETSDTKWEYNENPSLLRIDDESSSWLKTTGRNVTYFSNALRSNCKVTGQPDWGSIYITTKGTSQVDAESLLRYIVSFRNENHFHEEVCETIFMRLNQLLSPNQLSVGCFYTRRGGIDINPIRVSNSNLIEELYGDYIDVTKRSSKLPRQ